MFSILSCPGDRCKSKSAITPYLFSCYGGQTVHLSLTAFPSVASLIDGLDDPVDEIRGAAAQALGSLGEARAIEPLTRCLKDGDAGVRQAAAAALDKLRKQPRAND